MTEFVPRKHRINHSKKGNKHSIIDSIFNTKELNKVIGSVVNQKSTVKKPKPQPIVEEQSNTRSSRHTNKKKTKFTLSIVLLILFFAFIFLTAIVLPHLKTF